MTQRAVCERNLFPLEFKKNRRHVYQTVHKQLLVVGILVRAQKSSLVAREI